MRTPRRDLLTACPDQGFEEEEGMEISIHMRMSRMISVKISVARPARSANSAGLASLALVLLALSGCSGGSSLKPEVNPIAFTDANGTVQKPLTSLTASQGTFVDVALIDDPQALGADWSVYCGNALPPGTPLPPGQTQDESCGTFTPAHTISTINGQLPAYVTSGKGYVTFYTAPAVPPKEGTVTLYATATSDPSMRSSVTLAIEGLSISVGFAPPPPSTLTVGASAQIRAMLNNDVANAGVNWTAICGSNDCGSFAPTKTASGVATTYTAPATIPAGDTVKVTATSVADPTRAFTATIQIVSPI